MRQKSFLKVDNIFACERRGTMHVKLALVLLWYCLFESSTLPWMLAVIACHTLHCPNIISGRQNHTHTNTCLHTKERSEAEHMKHASPICSHNPSQVKLFTTCSCCCQDTSHNHHTHFLMFWKFMKCKKSQHFMLCFMSNAIFCFAICSTKMQLRSQNKKG